MPPPRPYDPLIAYDFSSWMDRLKGVVKRSWGNVLTLMLLGAVLPAIGVIVVVVGLVAGAAVLIVQAVQDGGGPPVGLIIIGAVVMYLVLVAALVYLNSVTGLSVMKAIANDAAGQPVPLATVYKSSLRLGWPTLGWQFLAGLALVVGLLFCIVPGIYLYVALSMLLPVMAFERRNGFAGSFRLVHTNFWPTAGRVVILYLFAAVMSYAVNIISNVVVGPLGALLGDDPSPAAIVLLLVVMLLMMLLSFAATLLGQGLLLCGYTVTYAELRGRLQPELTAAHLAAEANAS